MIFLAIVGLALGAIGRQGFLVCPVLAWVVLESCPGVALGWCRDKLVSSSLGEPFKYQLTNQAQTLKLINCVKCLF